MSDLAQDVRYALRAFRASPGFTAAAVLSLAIGIGANTAIFSVMNALLLRALPYKDASRLVILWNRSPGLNITEDWFSTAQYNDIKTGHGGFDDVAIAIGRLANLTGDDVPERVTVVQVSSNLLPMLGVRAAQGRLFVPEEDSGKSANTAILTDAMWTRRYGRNPNIVGKTILLNGVSRQVVGVLPRGFFLPHEVLPTLYGGDQAEIFVPMPLAPGAAQNRRGEDYNIIAKLKPGVSVAQAQSEMDAITARLRRDHPDVYPPNGGLTFGIVPLLEQVVGDVRLPLLVLLGAVEFVLLIACANVANLVLSRAVSRQREIAIRAALGASRRRVFAQLLTESVTLALFGAVLGVLLAYSGIAAVRVLGPHSVPRIAEIAIDGRVLLFTMSISVVSGILFGLAPAWRLSRLDLQSSLKAAGRGTSGGSTVFARGANLRRLLVVSELALSVVLLIGAGLLIRSFSNLHGVSPGFHPHDVLTFDLTLAGRKYADRPMIVNTYRELWRRLEGLPGVTAAGGITALPFSTVWAWGPITVEGRIPPPGENFINADQRVVSGHYFEAMQIPLVRGRFFDDQDTNDHPRVAVIDETMANEFWPGQDPLGKRIRTGFADSKDPWITIVGVVGNVKQYTLESNSRIAFYLPQTQGGGRALSVVVRGSTDPARLASAAKSEVQAIDPDLPLYAVQTMDARVDASLARRKFTMTLLGVFAALAFVLGAIGIYGLMSYQVSQGERELGIRIALGATQSRIIRLVVGQGSVITALGLAVGLSGALALTRVMRTLLFGIAATDPLTFTGVAVMIGAVALAASYVPARRASRVDPMISLRAE